MCGRYTLTATREELDGAYPVDLVLTEHHPRWNIAPTQEAPVLIRAGRTRRVEALRWGLIPHWARDPSIGRRLVNARSESVRTKAAFRDPWRAGRRCLVLTDGFYEWRKPPSGKGPRTPFWIRMADEAPFALAGLWEAWGSRDSAVRTFTVLTTEPNALVATIHDRMPVVLPRSAWEAWVDPRVDSEALSSALEPFPANSMRAFEVGSYVNDPRHEGPACVSDPDGAP